MLLVWFNNSTYSDPADDPNVEIVRCTISTGDILTIDRHQEGTPASNKNASGKIYKMLLSPTKKTIDDIQTESQSNVNTHSILSTGIHGVTGNVVGTSDVQELTNKTLTAPTIDDFTNGNHTHTADNTGGIVDHLNLASIGTNSHAAIDTHIAATGTSVHDLGSMSTQPSDAVSITGGTITGTMVKTTLGLQLPVGLNKWVT